LVTADGLGVRGPRGWVFRDVSLTVRRGSLLVIAGESGSGRTSLLLTLGGRMKPTEGTVTVGGMTKPHEIQRVSALGVMTGVNELEPELTVGEHVREALDIRYNLLRRSGDRKIAEVLDRAGLDWDPKIMVHTLAPEEQQLLGIALALTGEPELLLLDDVDLRLRPDRQALLWQEIKKRTADGPTIVATCADPGPADGIADEVLVRESADA
jgi:ABC-type multidrug transport system ATPase subunit